MSRKSVTLTLLAYFVAALVIAVILEAIRPFPKIDVITVSRALGAAAGLFVISGVIPLIVWAFRRFKPEHAKGPLVAWAITGLVLAYFTSVGNQFDDAQKIDKWSSQANLTGKDRAEFVRGATRSCGVSQRQNSLNQQIGVTEKQIADYCDCYADGLTRVLTAEDLKFFASNGRPGPGAQEKIDGISSKCTGVVFNR